MRTIGGAVVAAAAGLLLGAGIVPARVARAEEPPANSVPFPTTGRQTVRAQGKTYVIDGKQVIPGGSVIRVEANVLIKGINNASLEVKGGLLVHGTEDCWVRIENVDFSPTVKPDNEVHFDMANLFGCTFVHGETAAFEGGFTIENSALQHGCKFAVRMKKGFLRIMTTNWKVPCVIDCQPAGSKVPEVAIRTSWMDAVTFSGDASATIRDSETRGPLEAKDFTDLYVDGVDLFQGAVFRQRAEGSFSKLKLVKCNVLYGMKLVLDRPTTEKTKMEKVLVERFHFEAGDAKADMTDKQIAERIDDGYDNPAVSVKAFWQNPQKSKHYFLSESLQRRRPAAPE
jgi:hypothetical protein